MTSRFMSTPPPRWPRRSCALIQLVAVFFVVALPATAQPRLVADIDVTPSGSTPSAFVELNGTVFFSADRFDVGREVFFSDGTAAGTTLLVDANPGPRPSFDMTEYTSRPMITVAGRLYFVANTDGVGEQLWRTIVWPAAGQPLAAPPYAEPVAPEGGGGPLTRPDHLRAFGDRLVFAALSPEFGRELWITDGTPEGTRLLADFEPGPGSSTAGATPFGSSLLILVRSPSRDGELWLSDGSPAGTIRFVQLHQGFGIPSPTLAGFSVYGSKAFFSAETVEHGVELWVTDGTAESTGRLTDLRPGPDDGLAGSGVSFITPHGLVFTGCTNAQGCEPWVSDGTAEGTRLLREIFEGPVGSHIRIAVQVAGRTFMVISSRLWITDGTPENTRLLLEGPSISPVVPPVAAGDRLFFAAEDSLGRELWVSDGTADGTRRVVDLQPNGSSTPRDLAAFGEGVAFSAEIEGLGRELWISDGSAAGTRLVLDIAPGPASSDPLPVELAGKLWLRADDRSSGPEPWTSDGTAGGTRQVIDLEQAGTEGSSVSLVDALERHAILQFPVHRDPLEPDRRHYWISDGTEAGTVPMPDPPGLVLDGIFGGLRLAEHFVFSATSSPGASSLFRFDDDGSTRNLDIPDATVRQVAGDHLFFTKRTGMFGPDATLELWSLSPDDRRVRLATLLPTALTPSHAATTAEVARSRDTSSMIPPSLYPASSQTLAFGDRLAYFQVDNGGSTVEFGDPEWLWISDGTPQGTHTVGLVTHLSAFSLEAVGLDDLLLFVGWDEQHGRELWRSDGTADGTALLVDLEPGPDNSAISDLETYRGHGYFRLTRPGAPCSTLWQTDGSAAGTREITGCVDRLLPATDQLLALRGEELWRLVAHPPRLERVVATDRARVDPFVSIAGTSPGITYLRASDPEHGEELWRTDGTGEGTFLLGDISPGLDGSGAGGVFPLGGETLFAADDGVHGRELWATPLVCAPSPETLCLAAGRFQARVHWRDALRSGHRGQAGSWPITDLTGAFWFFSPENPELLVKVLDGRDFNGRFWVFFASLSDVGFDLEVLDTATGEVALYAHPAGNFASVGDTTALDGQGTAALSPLRPSPPPVEVAGDELCPPSPEVLCLGGGRFRLSVEWRDFTGRRGVGRAVPLAAGAGAFWFFDPLNLELAVKVHDGRAYNDHFWVFYGGLTNLEFTLRVEDTLNATVKTYHHPLGGFVSAGDTTSF